MKIKELNIIGAGGIHNLVILPHDQMNIICGPNGIGKTTVLECVGHLFSAGETTLLKRNVTAEQGNVIASLSEIPDGYGVPINVLDPINVNFKLNFFEPNKNDHIGGLHQLSSFILSLKTNRTFVYSPLNAVTRDTEKPPHVTYSEASKGIPLTDVKNWFVNRYLYSAHPGALKSMQMDNFELAKSCFSKLNPDFKFLRVDARTNEILVSSPSGDIYYEYLSSGFKSCLSILFGIIKEIEFRFSDTRASEFKGIVLIDELELHLHPDWQSQIVEVLCDTFPGVQFFVTTHSPHIVQSAAPETIIALERQGNDVGVRNLPKSEYGFKGWTIEEVLEDVMGMSDTRTSFFRSAVDDFTSALNNEDIDRAQECFERLDRLLHPMSPARKLFSFQLSALSGGK